MKQKQIYFKSDFTVILASESQWGGCPFRLSFYTASPSRAFVASFDGENWENCRLLDDGRLEVAINQKNGTMQTLMGIGTLMCAPEFYLDNDAFRDHVCNEFVKPFAPVFIDTDGTEYNVILDLNGSSTLVTIGTLPAFYMRGPMGDVDWEKVTPEQLEILQRPAREAAEIAINAANFANDAADKANAAASSANTESASARVNAQRAGLAAQNADKKAELANEEATRAGEQADAAWAASVSAQIATRDAKTAAESANIVKNDMQIAMSGYAQQFAQIKKDTLDAADSANNAAEDAISAMENIEAPKDGKAYNRKDGAWTVAEGGMTPAEREKLTALDLKVGELGDFLTNEEIDDIFLDGLKIVDGMLVGSGELEGDTYTISGLNVEDGIAII